MVQTASQHGTQCVRVGVWQCSPTVYKAGECVELSMGKRSRGIILKSRVSFPVPGFLSSATWPSMPQKHYNGLNQTTIAYLFLKIKYFLFVCPITRKQLDQYLPQSIINRGKTFTKKKSVSEVGNAYCMKNQIC